MDAATYAVLQDPELSGQPPDGLDAIVTEGAFRRATFVQPSVQLRPHDLLEIRTGVVLSWATAPIAQPLYTVRNGGVPTNHHEVISEGTMIGTEFDWAVRVGPQPDEGLAPSFEVQGGHLLVGKPLQGAGPTVIHHLMGIARVQF